MMGLNYIIKASKNATVTIWPYTRFNAVEALLSNKSVTLWLRYQSNIFLVLIKQSR